jgi:bifunctional DNase/RNase
MLVELELTRIIINELSDRQVIDLRERGGERRLPITIGIFEATSIERYAKRVSLGRPLTHQLIVEVALQLGGQLQDVVITELHEQTFHAVLRIRHGDNQVEIDCRPSDAIAVSVACDPVLPIYAAEEVLDAVARS